MGFGRGFRIEMKMTLGDGEDFPIMPCPFPPFPGDLNGQQPLHFV